MRRILFALAISATLTSCNKKAHTIVDVTFVDSLLDHYQLSEAQIVNQKDIDFWKKKLDASQNGFLENQQYAATLAIRFHLYGDISDLKAADSIIQQINQRNHEQEAGPLRSVASYAIQKHRFHEANEFVQKALALGSEQYASELLYFDAAFELGDERLIKSILDKIKSTNEYGYFFRLAKYQHLHGALDNAIMSMKKSGTLAGNNIGLIQTSLSNTADLYMHAADPEKANELYMQSIRLDAADFHSLLGIGWIALVHDKNAMLAKKIFDLVITKSNSPEILLKLAAVSELRSDTVTQKKYVSEFVSAVSDTIYGNMYNKYLIDLYTGILDKPSLAVAIAEKELENRRTAQTYSWYVWSLFQYGEKEKAWSLYEKYVSGKPLEGLELYYMGKMMKAMNKVYNAEQYFKAAYSNRYDLGPARQMELEAMQ